MFATKTHLGLRIGRDWHLSWELLRRGAVPSERRGAGTGKWSRLFHPLWMSLIPM